jgi:hypothetical protein
MLIISSAVHSSYFKSKAELLGILTRLEKDFTETEADARHDANSAREDLKNKNLEERHALRIQLEGTIEDLWKQFQTALEQYNTNTSERKKQFEELKAKDQKNALEIDAHMRRLINLQVIFLKF